MVLSFSPLPELKICATKIFMPGERHITRFYNKSVLILMTDGILRFRENGVDFELSSPEYYIQREGLLQEGIYPSDGAKYFFIEFTGYFSQNGDGIPLRGNYNLRKINSLIEEFEEQFKSRNANLFLLNSYMLRIFSSLVEENSFRDEKSQITYLIKNLIDSQYSTEISLLEISQKFGYSEDYIIRIFRERYSMTPHKYLIDIRMEHAKWLLENTDLAALQVASSVGYSDFSSFYRSFVKKFDISPSQIKSKLFLNK